MSYISTPREARTIIYTGKPSQYNIHPLPPPPTDPNEIAQKQRKKAKFRISTISLGIKDECDDQSIQPQHLRKDQYQYLPNKDLWLLQESPAPRVPY